MIESLSQTIIRMQERLTALRAKQTADEMDKMQAGYSLVAHVVQIGGVGCYLGSKQENGKTIMGGVFGIENAERFDHRSALHASMNLREADGTKSNSGSVVLFSTALEQAISGTEDLILTMEQHLQEIGDKPDFV